MPALGLLLARSGHVVAQVVEAELVVGAVGDVGVVRALLVVPVVVLGDHDADREAERLVDPAHPRRVTLHEVVVHRHEVDAVPGERVEVGGQGGDERLALAGLHLGDPAEVERRAAHDLHVEVALAERALRRLADRGERLGEELVEELDARLAVVAGGLVDPAGGSSSVNARSSASDLACISGSSALTSGTIVSRSLSLRPSPACRSLLKRPTRRSAYRRHPSVLAHYGLTAWR